MVDKQTKGYKDWSSNAVLSNIFEAEYDLPIHLRHISLENCGRNKNYKMTKKMKQNMWEILRK